MSKRILHITDSLERTGATAQVLTLSRGLVERGFDVHVAALDGNRALAGEFQAAGISTASLGRRWALDPVVYWKLRRLVGRLRPDVVHTWSQDTAVLGYAAAHAGGVQDVVTGLYRIDPWRGFAARLIDRRLGARTPRLVTSSAHVRDWWVRYRELPVEKFTVIPPGVPPAKASDVGREELLAELQLPADARLIGVVGRLAPEKRVRDLIWAADLLRVLHNNLRLLVIGDGPLRSQLEQYARLASDLDHIRFLGERADVWRIMPHLDVLWNASENRAHSIANLEAMAAGVPVIASDMPLNRELVLEDETGYLISLNERSGRADRARHTDRIFTDRELAARLSGNSRQHVARCFDWEHTVRAYADLYAATGGSAV